MAHSFNLIDQPFIPVVGADQVTAELGLSETLRHAHELVELRDPSPLVTAALHRLLLAILHAVDRGPKTRAERIAIRQAGRFDAERIDAYFEQWKDRFDLFHPKYPFMQRGGYAQSEPSSVNRLVKELARGNNPTLFDHTNDEPPIVLSPAAAARALIAEHAFAFSAGRGKQGEPHTLDGPTGRGAIVYALGDTLFETLWLNLTVYNGQNKPVASSPRDQPIWESTNVGPYEDSSGPRGFLDYLTWQSRTIHLHPVTVDGSVGVQRVSYSQGRVWAPPANFYDPFTAYRRDAESGDRALQFQEGREVWRDAAALFQFSGVGQFRGPTVLHTIGELVNEGHLPRSARYRVMVAGAKVESGQPNVIFWRHEVLPLPLAYLDDDALVGQLRSALELTEEVAKALEKAAEAVAKTRLAANSDSRPDSKRVGKIVQAMAPERFYWSRLELPFRTFLTDLAAIPPDARDGRLFAWYWDSLDRTAVRAFDQCVAVIDAGRDLKAVNAGRGVLFAKLRDVRTTGSFRIPDQTPAGAP
jgi:CRISPR system Cascade subunit CasA